ncbi:EamA family transporter [Burkholderia ubonensis]|uniref:EamA family transporter n=1 Tax=Burkholderia ubonensis TaxID=101571 RepID=UPI0009B373A0|nr:EamA family transporter [Burkholderia ubonensis]
MSLRAFRTLVAIARHRAFARAGAAIGLTQSAVSLQIKALESEFNVQLFDRSRRQPALTEAGRILVAQAEQILAMVDRIPDALSDEKKLVGRLRIGAIQTALAGPLPDALLALRHAHPSLRVQVSAGVSAELAQRVAAGELDAAITTHPVKPHPAELTWTPLYEDRFWLFAPPHCTERDAGALLEALPFIRFDAQAWAGRMIAAELRRLGVLVVISRGQLVTVLADLHGTFDAGERYMLCAVVSWAAYTVIGRYALDGLSPLVSTTYATLWGLALLIGASLLDTHAGATAPLTWQAAGAMAYLGAVGTVVAFVWYSQGIRALGPARTAVFTNLVPVFGVLLSVVLLGESLTRSMLAGGVLVIAGVMLTNRVDH